ncbi:MAG: putative PEP-binding protein, partial [Pseudomonadota bacterium]|nr:putative PEP-binding protein [Pseudomonadota bacterium]
MNMPEEMRLQGVPLSPGVALGRVCRHLHVAPGSHPYTDVGQMHEWARLEKALTWMSQRLQQLAQEAETRLGQAEADIFQAHRMILEDEELQQRLFDAIELNGSSAREAVRTELDVCRTLMQLADCDYLGQRAEDIAEIQRQLLDHLDQVVACPRCKDVACASVGECQLGVAHILLSQELTAGLIIETDKHTAGFLVDKGGADSHAAILARALQRPAVSAVPNLCSAISLDSQILLNGYTGEVILNPSRQTLAGHANTLAGGGHPALEIVDPVPRCEVLANIVRAVDVREALAARAEGIGLYRTETEFLAAGRQLSESEQENRYTEVVKSMSGMPVCFRLLDLGADKAAPWLDTAHEENPALGCRGARLLLARSSDLLRDQARALARASRHGPVRVLYPMIIDVDQFRRLRALFDEAVAD